MKNLLLCLFLLQGTILCAQSDSIIPFEDAYKRVYTITRLANVRPLIDGRLSEEFWQNTGVWSDVFVQVMPTERLITPNTTRVKLFYDDKNIYIGVHCKDIMPDRINRFIGNRDDNSVGDLISIAFDTYHDYRAAPEFNLNVGGNKTDLIVTDRREVNMSWNAVWEARTHVSLEDSCWTAELSIPFSQLRYNQLSNDGIWGLHVRRIIRRSNEVQNWSLIPLKNNGHVFSFGEMHGMNDLPRPRGIEILPYAMGKYKREPKIEGSPYQKGNAWGGNVGLDAKFALSDFTLDLTVNPDFGQVELDPSVMNLTAYETFYDEKRPFFLEGKHILDFSSGGNRMFYTRRIGATPRYSAGDLDNTVQYSSTQENVPILGALKLTGTNKYGLTLGLVQSVTARSSDKATYDTGNEKKIPVEPLTNYTVARVQKNWKGNVLLGGMLTSVNRRLETDALEERLVRNAFAGGVDYQHYFNNRLYFIDFKGMFSYVEGSEEAITRLQMSPTHYYQRPTNSDYLGVDNTRRSLAGTGGHVTVGRKGNAKWTFEETFEWNSPGFELNDIGYLRDADVMTNETEVAFRQTNPWKIFRSNTLSLEQENYWNYSGEAIDNSLTFEWDAMYLNRFESSLSMRWTWNDIETRRLYGGPEIRFEPSLDTEISVNTDKAKRVVLTMKYENSHNFDGISRLDMLSPKVSFRLGNHLLLSGEFNYSHNRDNLQYVMQAPLAGQWGETSSLMGYINQRTYGLTMKMQLNLTPDFSLQFYGSPFTSIGKYSDFKLAADTKSSVYENRFTPISAEHIKLTDEGMYEVRYDKGAGFDFRNPDFSFNEFRSNLVARWEYRPGSTIYLVWEHTMSNRDKMYQSGWGDNLDRMFGLPATNVFMVKLNYWFSL